MGNERRYFWARWGEDWEIAIYIYDEDECEFIWILNGMQILTPPDEIGNMVVRESRNTSTSESALPISDVVKRIENYAPDPVELPEFDLSKKGSHIYCIEWGELKARKNEYDVYQKLLKELR